MVIRKTKEKRQNIKRASSWMLYYWNFLGMCRAIAAVYWSSSCFPLLVMVIEGQACQGYLASMKAMFTLEHFFLYILGADSRQRPSLSNQKVCAPERGKCPKEEERRTEH